MIDARSRHIVVVEAYEGLLEPLSDEPASAEARRGLGLPLEALANLLDARITVLHWDRWLDLERKGTLFTTWSRGTTRAAEPPPPAPPLRVERDGPVRTRAIAATDPGDGRTLGLRRPSLRGYGLLADNDPLVYLGHRLARELESLHRSDPVDLTIVPAWGGLGCLAQLERTTGVQDVPRTPFVAVVTDSSARRQRVNQEGFWSREAASRRQMEELSIALAEGTIVSGPRAEALAIDWRLADCPSPITIPRRVPAQTLEAVAAAAAPRPAPMRPPTLFTYGRMDAASGALVVLDAVARLARRGTSPPASPVVCAGPDAHFAPMAPRTFREYWSSRPFVRELADAGWWSWSRERPAPSEPVLRLNLAPWAHLPDPWSELARGSMFLLSPAEADGLAPGASLPEGCLLGAEPDASNVERAITRLLRSDPARLERDRAALCSAVVSAQRGSSRQLGRAAGVLESLMSQPSASPPLDRVARMLLDRTRTLREIDQLARPATPAARPSAALAARGVPSEGEVGFPSTTAPESGAGSHFPATPEVEAGSRSAAAPEDEAVSLSVVVPCYEMGPLLRETVESVWQSTRRPDELIVVDDGSKDSETIEVLAALEAEAAERGLPLRVVRQGNRGLAGARNAGAAAAHGDYICFLDADDLIEPSFFGLALGILRRNPGLGGVAAWSVIFGAEGVTGHWNAPQPELPLQLVENCVFVPLVVRRALLTRLGGFDEGQRYNYEDWELSARILARGRPIITIPAYLQRYRVRHDSLYRTMTPVQNQVMRERMLEHHRATAERFSVEIAMMVENRLQRRLHEQAEDDRGTPSTGRPLKWMRGSRQALRHLWKEVGSKVRPHGDGDRSSGKGSDGSGTPRARFGTGVGVGSGGDESRRQTAEGGE